MNSTNRGFNRTLIVIVGILLVAAGVIGIALATVPAFARNWAAESTTIGTDAPQWVAVPALGAVSALTIGVGVTAVILALLLIVFIARQGRGQTTRVAERRAGDTGATLMDVGVPRALLVGELSGRPEFVSTRVSAYAVRRTPTLKVSVQCRRGVAPTDATAIVVAALDGMDQILGTQIPALIQVGGGFRARVASRARLS